MIGVFVRWRPLVAAALAMVTGGFAMSQTGDMSELGRVFPFTAGLIAVAAGAALALQAVLVPGAPLAGSAPADTLRAGLLALCLLAWSLLLDPLGFVPTSAVALVTTAAIARREPMTFRSVVVHAVAGVVLVLGFSMLLSEVLNVRLP